MFLENGSSFFWRRLSEDHKRTLAQLETALQASIYFTVAWKEVTTKMVRKGPWGIQAFEEVEVTKKYSSEEKRALRQTVVACLYRGLRKTPAEGVAIDMINQYSRRPFPEPSK